MSAAAGAVAPVTHEGAAAGLPQEPLTQHHVGARTVASGAEEQEHNQHADKHHHVRAVPEMTWPGVSGGDVGTGKSLGRKVMEALPGGCHYTTITAVAYPFLTLTSNNRFKLAARHSICS